MDLSIRILDPTDADAYREVDEAAFSFRWEPERANRFFEVFEFPRTHGAFGPNGDLWGAAGAFSQILTLPGGSRIEAPGVTAVGVVPTHRRRGVLTALMAAQLDDVAARGEPVAVLNASEATIYRRFGYGVSSRANQVRIDRARARLVAPVDPSWSLRLVDDDEARAVAPAIFEAYVASRPGEMSRPGGFWEWVFGPLDTWLGGGEHFTVVCDAPSGAASGYAIYKVDHDPPDGHWRVVVAEVVAADVAAETALWRYLLDIDLTDTVQVTSAPLDDPLRWAIADPRAYQVTGQSDFLWARIVDPVAALAARRYRRTDELVLELNDLFRPETSGRYVVATGPTDGEGWASAEAAPTDRTPDLTMDVADLGSLYLGGVTASTLARAGRIGACTEGALARADQFFAAERAPFCVARF